MNPLSRRNTPSSPPTSKYHDPHGMFLESRFVMSRSVRGSMAWITGTHWSSVPVLYMFCTPTEQFSSPNSLTIWLTVMSNSRYSVQTRPLASVEMQYSPQVSG